LRHKGQCKRRVLLSVPEQLYSAVPRRKLRGLDHVQLLMIAAKIRPARDNDTVSVASSHRRAASINDGNSTTEEFADD
jgi:hypothetical protein